MIDNLKIIQDISLLYELSLSVGNSFNPKENCAHFLSILMSRKNLYSVSVWIKEGDHFSLLYGSPINLIQSSKIKQGHFIWRKLETVEKFAVKAKEKDFEQCIQEDQVHSGSYAIFKLADIGFLKLYKQEIDGFQTEELNQLYNVVKKFGFLLKGSIAHEQLVFEQEKRQLAEKALRFSQARYQFVVQNLSEGIIITDLEGRVTFVNERMEQLTGYSKEEIIGQKAYDLIVAKTDKNKITQNIEQRKKGVSNDYVVEHVHKSGRKWMGRIVANPYKNAKGEIVGTMGAVSDITAQQYAEIKVRESEQMLRKIIDTSLDAIINIDEEGNVIDWSQQAEKIFGYKREEVMGKNMGDIIVPEKYREAHARGMKHYLKTGEGPVLNNRIEITAIDKTEREFPIELSISPLTIDGKQFFSGFIRDITDRKKAEQDLISAKQAAEQAQLAEQQFLANMSHEIRTPMNAVIGMTHLLYETNPSAAQKEYLDSLRFSADSLMGIINNILDLSKIEANEIEFEKRTFNLTELLKSLQQTFQFKVREKPISVVLDIDPKIKNHLIGDSTRLNQILTNLLGNASKFTQKGTIGIRVKLKLTMGGKYIIEFQVHDTGIGIDPDNIEKIFENFKQADVRITRKFGGTGLGLTIVKQLVELQEGTIEVTSKKQEGSKFTIVLPFEDSGIPQNENPLKDDAADFAANGFKDVELLVVEDNPMNQKLISKILESWECSFEIASDGFEALDMTQKKKYNIILMDIHMPEMDGCETTQKIRANSENLNHESPIVALTAAALLDEKNRALDSGMNDFLTKPFSPKQLKKRLAKWLNLKIADTVELKTSVESPSTNVNIDFSYLNEMSRGDETFIKDMIQIFLNEIPSAMEQIQTAYHQHDWIKVADIAHRIKSNYMMVGMKGQQENALTIEKSIKTKTFDPNEIGNRLIQLKEDSVLAYPLLEQAMQN